MCFVLGRPFNKIMSRIYTSNEINDSHSLPTVESAKYLAPPPAPAATPYAARNAAPSAK